MTPPGDRASFRTHLLSAVPLRSFARTIPASTLLIGLAIAIAACDSNSSTSTGPSPVKCQVSLAAAADSIEPAGGKGAITVSAQPECSWTASSDAAWISSLTPSSGQGGGRVEFQAAANPAGTMRQGHIAVNDQQIPIQQQPAPCRFDVSPLAPRIDGAGGTITIAVTAPAGCSWQAVAEAGWLTIANTGGSGSGSVSLRVAPNGGEPRSVSVLVAGQTVTVTQSSSSSTTPTSPDCVFALDRANEAMPAAGGIATVGVTGPAGCSRTATSQAPWITVVAGATGTGRGAVTFNVASNNGPVRTGILTIAGGVFTVTQAEAGTNSPNCAYAITPTNQSIDAGGGAGAAIALSTAAGCPWTAASQVSWLALTSPANGSGSSTVTFTVAANSAAARTGTLTIAGKTFTLNQAAAACTFSINPTDQAINEKGGAIAVAVSAGAGCAWTATSNESWITITEGAAGNGNGTVRFDVASTGGKKRIGTLTIAGQTFTVDQNKKND